MATASESLFKMSVPDLSGGNQGLLMPKLQFRFRVNFLNFGIGSERDGIELTKQVISCARPNLSFDEIEIPVYNSRMYLAGKHTWESISISLRDDASGNVSRSVGRQLQKQMDFVEQASAATGQDYKFQTDIEILDGGNARAAPSVLETWELYGCFIVSANYNELDYGNNEPVTIELSIRYDNAVQSRDRQLDVGVGGGRPLPRGSVLGRNLTTGNGS